MSYAIPADMLARYDARRLGDLVNDDSTRASTGALSTNANLQAALDDASGMLDAAIQRGQRYSPTDIANLIAAGGSPTNPLYNSYKLLVRICCDLAYGLLVGRRAYNATDTAAQAPRYVEALRQLQLLENGEWIFVTQGALAAGVPVPTVQLSSQIGLLSSISRLFGDLAVYPAQNYPLYSSFNRE